MIYRPVSHRPTCAVHGDHDATTREVIDGRTYWVCSASEPSPPVERDDVCHRATGRDEVAAVLRTLGQGTVGDIAGELGGFADAAQASEEKKRYDRVNHTIRRMLIRGQLAVVDREWRSAIYRLTGVSLADGRSKKAA